jgi:hypothetical protein
VRGTDSWSSTNNQWPRLQQSRRVALMTRTLAMSSDLTTLSLPLRQAKCRAVVLRLLTASRSALSSMRQSTASTLPSLATMWRSVQPRLGVVVSVHDDNRGRSSGESRERKPTRNAVRESDQQSQRPFFLARPHTRTYTHERTRLGCASPRMRLWPPKRGCCRDQNPCPTSSSTCRASFHRAAWTQPVQQRAAAGYGSV